ncbi:MAG TPA: sigma-70 family RNA polymerase sigma factor [Mucilaginibacter sp.]|jgi:RNA polymerase sigma factor (sigma-70 family)|nr:sigma-70 family RNA polymerase sigma factor [Mucilaginibacter sp.]
MIGHSTDDELLRMIREDDEKAFAVLVYRYNVRLFKIINARIRSDDDAKDILQEIFISFWNNRLLVDSSVLGYLSRAAFYAVIDWQIENKKKLSRVQLLLTHDEPATVPVEEHVIANELQNELLEEIEKLSSTTSAVFRMSRLEQKSIREIAEELHLSEQTVKNNLSIALQHLRSRVLRSKLATVLITVLLRQLFK